MNADRTKTNGEFAVSFALPIVPMPQPRPRATIIWPGQLDGARWNPGRDPTGGYICPHCHRPLKPPRIHVYDVQESQRYKTALGLMSSGYRPRVPVEYPDSVHLDVTFQLPAPESLEKWKRMIGWPAARMPDLSNLVKPVEDATDRGFWTNDALITRLVVTKEYAFVGQPGVVVSVRKVQAPKRIREEGHEGREATDVLAVISCKSKLTSIAGSHRDYCGRMRQHLGQRQLWLFAECVTSRRQDRLLTAAKTAGYDNFWYLYRFDEKTLHCEHDEKLWMSFLKEIQHLAEAHCPRH